MRLKGCKGGRWKRRMGTIAKPGREGRTRSAVRAHPEEPTLLQVGTVSLVSPAILGDVPALNATGLGLMKVPSARKGIEDIPVRALDACFCRGSSLLRL